MVIRRPHPAKIARRHRPLHHFAVPYHRGTSVTGCEPANVAGPAFLKTTIHKTRLDCDLDSPPPPGASCWPAAVHCATYEYLVLLYTAPGGPVTVFSVLERSWLSEVSGGFPPFVSMVGYRIGTYPAPPSSPSNPSSNGSLAESVDAEVHLGFLINGIADPADQVCQTRCP
ncbi:hypothetical protein Landi51_05770 [Colletotrichum acutatum]